MNLQWPQADFDVEAEKKRLSRQLSTRSSPSLPITRAYAASAIRGKACVVSRLGR